MENMQKWARIRFKQWVPLGKDGRCVTASKEHIELSRQIAGEGMVLLKNENEVLPLKKGTAVAVVGKGQHNYEIACFYCKFDK